MIIFLCYFKSVSLKNNKKKTTFSNKVRPQMEADFRSKLICPHLFLATIMAFNQLEKGVAGPLFFMIICFLSLSFSNLQSTEKSSQPVAEQLS